jgi:hypothetical protein
MWLSRSGNRVDVLVGNPPWLAYRHMTEEMQAAFRQMSVSRGLWQGAKVATHQDLSALFVARAVQLYLKAGGKFAFVMPNAAVDREQYAGFRSGNYPDNKEPATVRFSPSWDLRRLRPHFFPRGASVVFGSRGEKFAVPMGTDVDVWSGRLPGPDASWDSVKTAISRKPGQAKIAGGDRSQYADRFSQGATFSPRLLFMVGKLPPGPLGVPAGRVHVRSERNANEKKPWSKLPSMEGIVETEFVRPLLNGEDLLPYIVNTPVFAIVPWDPKGLLPGNGDRIELYPGLADWWQRAQQVWDEHRSSDRLTLIERVDYQRELQSQFPIPPLRVVYNTSGMHLVAAIVDDVRAVINSKLYWAALNSADEGYYICAILNSPITTELVRPYMSYGKDERDFHKHVWELPVEEYSPQKEVHARLVALGRKAAQMATSVQLDEAAHFSARRRKVRTTLASSDVGQEIDQIVFELLS